MNFLIEFIETKFPDLLKLGEDMPSVPEAGKGKNDVLIMLLLNDF